MGEIMIYLAIWISIDVFVVLLGARAATYHGRA